MSSTSIATRSIALTTCEHMMLHVNTNKREATEMEPYMTCALLGDAFQPAIE